MVRRIVDILYLCKHDLKPAFKDLPIGSANKNYFKDWEAIRDADVVIYCSSEVKDGRTLPVRKLIKSTF